MFRPFKKVIIRPSSGSSQQMLCIRWDPNVFTVIKCIKFNKSMYFITETTLGSQSVHSIC